MSGRNERVRDGGSDGAASEEPARSVSGITGTPPTPAGPGEGAPSPARSGEGAPTPARSGEGAPTPARPGEGSLARRVPDLGLLEVLLAVDRLGSLGRAAKELGITQPAASGRVRSLERQLGVGLVTRSPRGSRLTPTGTLVAGWARRVVEAAAAFDAG
ncbi:helix-turn-helix domain-containing protein, partial [Streptomyces sp. SPB074]|uniref:helix-turn-helix domain-containing protein n=1 Tax=Streptomyces sp. (strain SPB074) TaxID=465543 RepID=UPI0001D1DB93